ncbi:MAG TPA: NfeD family protein [Candidatus Ozemobacteraceae bacterium]
MSFTLHDRPAGRFHRLAGLLFLILSLLIGSPVPTRAQTAPASPTGGSGVVMVVPITGEIDSGLSFFLQRMLRRAEREQVRAVVLEINSNGGLVTAAQEMKDALLASKVTTVAHVKGRALSAAALIAISCHRIYMEPGAEMGAATPIKIFGAAAIQAAEAKLVSAFRAEFEAAAEARKRPKMLAASMVDKEIDTVPGLRKRGEILTLTSESALQHGFCDAVVTSLDGILRRLSLEQATVDRTVPTSGETVARWLTSPNVSVLLFTIGFWCLVLEFLVFGWGLLGWFGLVCFALFFGGHLFAYMAGFEAVLLFGVGLLLLLAEVFVIPGFGITGISGILAMCAGLVITFGGIYTATYAIAKIIALSIVMIILLYNLGPRLKLFDRFILKEAMTTEAGFVAVDAHAFDKLLHLEGLTVSPCRPAGIVRIGQDKYDVSSDGEFIERGRPVTVIAVEGTKIVVREVKG